MKDQANCHIYETGWLGGVLTRTVPVRLLNFSESGCAVESDSRFEPGTIARLRVEIGDETYVEDIDIVRCQRQKGVGSLCHIGGWFRGMTRLRPSVANGRARLLSGLFKKLLDSRVN